MAAPSASFRKFRDDVGAVAALEFALIAPVMLFFYVGGVELANGLAINVKVTETAHTVSDLVSQNKCVTSAQVNVLLNASSAVIAPYAVANAIVTVSELTTTGSGTATVTWSQSLNGTARTQGQAVALPSSLAALPSNTGLILGEASYTYKPNLGYSITGTILLGDSYFLYPRQTTFIPLQTSCP